MRAWPARWHHEMSRLKPAYTQEEFNVSLMCVMLYYEMCDMMSHVTWLVTAPPTGCVMSLLDMGGAGASRKTPQAAQ